jgi:signal transduction histidine kinase
MAGQAGLASDSRAPARRVRETFTLDPQRVIALLRVFVVVSMGILTAAGSAPHRSYGGVAAVLLVGAGVYAAVVLALVQQGRHPDQTAVTVLDSLFTLAVIASTGAAESQAVAVLPLAIVAAAVRQGLRPATLAAVAAGSGYAAVVLLVPRPDVPFAVRFEAAVWWFAYLLAFAVLAGMLRTLLDREHEEAVDARAQARAEQDAYQEERDLRARLLEAQQAQQDGIRVVLHEFRTPVTSLVALTSVLREQEPHDAQALRAAELVAAHARHLEQMLDQLADVAVSTGSAVGVRRSREVELGAVVAAAVHAAGLQAEDVEVSVMPAGAVVQCDEQQVRRILTNLMHNAAQHAPGQPVTVQAAHSGGVLRLDVLDRGPGLPDGAELLVTQKFVRLAEREGTSGLGLWIVQQLVAAAGGRLVLSPRPGGGLAARVALPLPGSR